MQTRSKNQGTTGTPVSAVKPVATKRKSQKVEKTESTDSKNLKTDSLVNNLLKSIEQSNEKEKEEQTTKDKQSKPKPVNKQNLNAGIRGKPKSGRPWKDVKQKFSSIKKSIHRHPFAKKQQLREELKHIKEVSRSIKADKKLENEELRQRREENAKRRLENERKAEIVQIIKNPAKLKRMKKKALRKIEKRDTSAPSKVV